MTLTRGLALFLSVITAGTLVRASGSNATPLASVRLTAISARVNAKGASLLIEASEPVAYTATRPDPLTLLLDFRNVSAAEVANSVAAGARPDRRGVDRSHPVARRPGVARADALAQPVGHHVAAIGTPWSSTSTSRRRRRRRSSWRLRPGRTAPRAARCAPSTTRRPPIRSRRSASTRWPADLGDAVAGGRAAHDAADHQARGRPRQPQPPLPPPAPAPMTTDQVRTERNGRQFTGHPISLIFRAADLRAVLRTFAEISGLNIVIDPRSPGPWTSRCAMCPWDQALDIILAANKLGYLIDGTIVRIAPLNVWPMNSRSAARCPRSRRSPASRGPDQDAQLRQGRRTAGAPDQERAVAARHRAGRPAHQHLIITDLRDRLTLASELITTLDRAQPQVEIEARIVQTNKDYARALGVQWASTATSTRRSATRRRSRFRTTARSAGGPARRADRRPAAAGHGQPRGPGGDERHRPGARLGQRRVRPRHRADGARAQRQRPPAVDPARDDAEQRGGRDDAGHPDSDSDRREQHRDGQLQGRRPDAQGDAADHRGQHRHHADRDRERVGRLQPRRRRHPADQHPARTPRCSSATGRRRSSAAST